ncbi:MAG: DoxX family protein [Bacteroidales bacterium]|nr:DoxX family protein [Bacteroidales bacterium]
MKVISAISRILTGLVFIFSGFVKAIDPLGSTYKFIDYFNAFHVGFLESLAFPLAILLSGIELVLGISLILAYKMRITAWTTLIFMSFFTLLTFILALTNPVHDCGCFGDALILTNWQTFLKNIGLMIFTTQIFMHRNKYIQLRPALTETLVLILFFIASSGLSLYSLKHLPLIDFRPYKVGTYIPAAMSIPEGSPQNEYETTLIYREISSGAEQEFKLDNYPKDDTAWEFVDAKSVLISKGYEPEIHDFNISAPSGKDITQDIITFEGYTFLLISYDITKASEKALIQANHFFQLAQGYEEVQFFAITASSTENNNRIKKSLDLKYEFCQADEISLKTIVRANPGLVLIQNGTIMNKWSLADFPKKEDLPAFNGLFSEFPFCKGCNLDLINQAPPGSKEDVYETVLYYRNIIDNSLQEFTIDNYPANSGEWVFEDSKSSRVQVGYESMLNKFSIQNYMGSEKAESLYFEPGIKLLFFIKDIYSVPSDLFQNITELGAMSMDYLGPDLKVFALVDAEGDDLLEISDQFIASFEYLHIDSSAMNSLSFNSALAIIIKDGIVIESYKDNEIPEPEELQLIDTNYSLPMAASELSPMTINSFKVRGNKLLILNFVLGFLLFVSVLRIYLDRNKKQSVL